MPCHPVFTELFGVSDFLFSALIYGEVRGTGGRLGQELFSGCACTELLKYTVSVSLEEEERQGLMGFH